jgi:hypothetical protein
MSYLGRSAQPGAFMVNVIPARTFPHLLEIASSDPNVVKSIPPWFPGAGFHAIAKEWGSYLTAMVDIPFEYVTNAMVSAFLLALAKIMCATSRPRDHTYRLL